MGKRVLEEPLIADLSEKKLHLQEDYVSPSSDIKVGTILTDIQGKKWKLGRTVGIGGFGEIYLASDCVNGQVKENSQYVAKIERHTSGPLFVEVHCYLNIARTEMINQWKTQYKLEHLGIPHYTSSGSHTVNGTKYRFLILPHLKSDLNRIFEKNNFKFNLKTVLTIARQTLNVLQYIHSKGYIHSDIKASNILLGQNYKSNEEKVPPVKEAITTRMTLRRKATVKSSHVISKKKVPDCDKIYLVDYGLACRYTWSNGKHKEFCEDERKAHAGTILFCSRDAHEGVQSRRSDLECLGYNMIYWLTSNLPWSGDLEDHELVYKKKKRCINNLKYFLELSFEKYKCPLFLYDYFDYLKKLKFEEEPDYDYFKSLFYETLIEYGYNDDLLLDFNNSEYGIRKIESNMEEIKFKREMALQILKRSPLKSNLPVKPMLRKQLKKHLKQTMNWSKILMDPEIIIKNALKLKKFEVNDSNTLGLLNLNIMELNPTAAMLNIYNKFMDRQNNAGSSPHNRCEFGDYIEGYNSAMMEVLRLKEERELKELQSMRTKLRGRSKKAKKTEKIAVAKQHLLRRTYSLRG